ncbi:hypothetical protein ABW19_dt0200477 [Dactylella cylindrospora]|nr:hypothetical protein ABW19_dt0200477 [Dactylella cylindrospora]
MARGRPQKIWLTPSRRTELNQLLGIAKEPDTGDICAFYRRECRIKLRQWARDSIVEKSGIPILDPSAVKFSSGWFGIAGSPRLFRWTYPNPQSMMLSDTAILLSTVLSPMEPFDITRWAIWDNMAVLKLIQDGKLQAEYQPTGALSDGPTGENESIDRQPGATGYDSYVVDGEHYDTEDNVSENEYDDPTYQGRKHRYSSSDFEFRGARELNAPKKHCTRSVARADLSPASYSQQPLQNRDYLITPISDRARDSRYEQIADEEVLEPPFVCSNRKDHWNYTANQIQSQTPGRAAPEPITQSRCDIRQRGDGIFAAVENFMEGELKQRDQIRTKLRYFETRHLSQRDQIEDLNAQVALKVSLIDQLNAEISSLRSQVGGSTQEKPAPNHTDVDPGTQEMKRICLSLHQKVEQQRETIVVFKAKAKKVLEFLDKLSSVVQLDRESLDAIADLRRSSETPN